MLFNNITTPGNAQGSTLSLGFAPNGGSVNFVLAGDSQTGFWSTNGPANWMQLNLPSLGTKTLRQLAMPGSHDAGMSMLSSTNGPVKDCNVLTQTKSIGGQLALGSRYFDLRVRRSDLRTRLRADSKLLHQPAIAGGKYTTGHFSSVDLIFTRSFFGGTGQSFDDMITDINTFTNDNKELIILNLSHDFRPTTTSSTSTRMIGMVSSRSLKGSTVSLWRLRERRISQP